MVFSKNLYLSSDIKKGYRKYIRALKLNKTSFLLLSLIHI